MTTLFKCSEFHADTFSKLFPISKLIMERHMNGFSLPAKLCHSSLPKYSNITRQQV